MKNVVILLHFYVDSHNTGSHYAECCDAARGTFSSFLSHWVCPYLELQSADTVIQESKYQDIYGFNIKNTHFSKDPR